MAAPHPASGHGGPGDRRAVPTVPPEAAHRVDHRGLPGGGGVPQGPAASLRRALHHPPVGGGGHRRPLRHGRRHHLRRAPARRRRGHGAHPRRGRGRLRSRGARDRRRSHEAGTGPLRLQGGPAGRHHAQDAGGDGQGPAGPGHQAGRPPPQHADPGRVAGLEAGAHRPGDSRHLRPAGAPPGHAGGQAAARGSVLRCAAPQALRRDRPHGRQPDPRARPVPGRDPRRGHRAAERGQHHRRGDRATEAPVVHLREDGRQGQGVRRDLRPGRDPGDRRLVQGLLRGAGDHPRSVDPGAGAVQGLHRHAQVQPVPVAAHDGDRPGRTTARGAGPHPRDAPPGRVGGGCPLLLQGGPLRGRRLVDADRRLATGDDRPRRVHGQPEGRPGPGRGLRVHPAGRRDRPAGRRHPGRLRLRHPHRSGPPLHRRTGGRSTATARQPAVVGRHGRDLHLEGGRRGPQPGLARLRRHPVRVEQDPTVVLPRAA